MKKIHLPPALQVTLYCLMASFVTYGLMSKLILRYAVTADESGVIQSVNDRAVLLLYAGLFVAALFLGGLLFFRRLTRRELLLSAGVAAAAELALFLISCWTNRGSSLALSAEYYLMSLPGWSTFIALVLYHLSKSALLACLVRCLAPFCFLLFGRE